MSRRITKLIDTNNRILIDSMNSTTAAGGTWAASGGLAANVTNETEYLTTGSGSIEFDSNSNAVVAIEDSTATAVNLSTVDQSGRIELDLWVPFDGTVPTNVNLRLGSDSSNYFEFDATTLHYAPPGQSGNFVLGWNRVVFDWNSASSETGTAVTTAIDYKRIAITHAADPSATDFYVSGLTAYTGNKIDDKALWTAQQPGGYKVFPVKSWKDLAFECVADQGTFTAGQVVFEGSNDASDGARWEAIANSYTPYSGGKDIITAEIGYRYVRARIREEVGSSDTGNYEVYLLGNKF